MDEMGKVNDDVQGAIADLFKCGVTHVKVTVEQATDDDLKGHVHDDDDDARLCVLVMTCLSGAPLEVMLASD